MTGPSASAEAILSAAFQSTGIEFLGFHRTLFKGEATDDRLHGESTGLAEVVRNLGPLIHEQAPRLRIGIPTDGYGHSGSQSVTQELDLLSLSIALTGRKMAEIPRTMVTVGDSESLRPLATLRDRVAEAGRRFIAIASVLGEADLTLSQAPLNTAHLRRLEKRLAQQIRELDDLLLVTREQIAIALAELSLGTLGKG
jgi:hypothetical protein